MRIAFPTDEEIEQGNRFKTYSNYLCSISAYLNETNYRQSYREVIESKGFQTIQGNKCNDINKLEKLLRNSWFTEAQLNITAQDIEFAQYSNHWAPVQLYYAVYLAIRGLFTSMGTDVHGEHASNLSAISEFIKQRSVLFPYPWKVLCLGDGNNANSKFVNLPRGISVNSISSLSNPNISSIWDFYGLFLKTTRQRQIDKKVNDWKIANNKKRILTKDRAAIFEQLRPTSFFDNLYRLRLRSNYEDADSFILSLTSPETAGEFNKSVRDICWHTLMNLELLISRYIGKNKFKTIAKQFIKDEKGDLSRVLVAKRVGVIDELL